MLKLLAHSTNNPPSTFPSTCSKPTVSPALALNQTYFKFTITPDTASPYLSYPPGGWTHYVAYADTNPATFNETVWCT